MKTFSPSEAAFEGFRVIRSHPGAVLAWAVVSMLVSLGSLLLARASLGGDFASAMATSQTTPGNPTAALATLSRMGPFIAGTGVVGLVVHAILSAAVFRAVLRPQDKGLGYLRLGGDELRLIGLSLIYLLLFFAVYIGLFIVLLIPLVAVGALANHGGQAGGGMVAMGLGIFVAYLAVLCLVIWLAVRLSLAAAMTFAERRIRVFGSWRATRGKFWSLLGCYLLAAIFALMIVVVSWIVSLSAGAVITGDWGALGRMPFKANYGAMVAAVTPGLIVQTVVAALFTAVNRAVFTAPIAAAYRDLTAKDDAPSVF